MIGYTGSWFSLFSEIKKDLLYVVVGYNFDLTRKKVDWYWIRWQLKLEQTGKVLLNDWKIIEACGNFIFERMYEKKIRNAQDEIKGILFSCTC